MIDVGATQLQAPNAQPIVLRRLVLLDVAARLERGEQTEHVVLVQLETLRELRHAQLAVVIAKLLEHVDGVGDGLDDVVGFLAAHGCENLF